MKMTAKVTFKKGEVVRQILDTVNNKAYMRTATMQPNSPTIPINPPTNFVDMSYIAEHETVLVLEISNTVMDLDNNPYAPIEEI